MRSLRILLVEDHPINRELAKDVLELAGHTVIEAKDVHEARSVLSRAGRPDVVVLDIRLPGGGGERVLADMRADPRLCQIPAVAVTAFAVGGDREYFHHRGFDGYIAKPIDTRTFADSIASYALDAPAPKPAPLVPSGGRILAVDDDADARQFVEAHLGHAGFRVFSVGTGEAALQALAEGHFDIVLLDIRLPDMNGYEVAERIRALPGGEQLAIVALTILDDTSSVERAIAAGADDYVSKPVRPEELVIRVRSLLRLKGFHDELRESNRIVRMQRDELRQLEAQKAQLTAMVAHDLKSPLGGVLNNARFLLDHGRLEEDASEAVEDIMAATGSMRRLIEDMLDVWRGGGQISISPRIVEIEALISEAHSAVKANLRARDQEVQIEISADVGKIQVDPDLMRRVLENLLDNCTKYAPRSTPIRISAKPDAMGVTVRVADRGRGIPADDRERIFAAYERLPSSKSERSSWGLGLAFCRIAIDAHGGRIWVDENPEGGSIFSFSVPASSATSANR